MIKPENKFTGFCDRCESRMFAGEQETHHTKDNMYCSEACQVRDQVDWTPTSFNSNMTIPENLPPGYSEENNMYFE